ncbi:hypothetical protein PILCRDRAFT_7037 [Piloderma croceum F 1598]|uniref:C2 domain-containing protein n=1 Tax=Piloderma croceum (strain F 1598) TaxID=765440 RepID=A0A0C3FVU7_PILCF|nr:hypothetical protein PILCRDRAFT_7037 [Piloderma croceum F 1598]
MDKPLPPLTSPKLSMDDAFRALPAGFCQFELTVIGTTGLRGMTAWSQGQGCYVVVAVGSQPLHKTTIAKNEGEPEWNDTFQFVAKRGDDLIVSVYVTGTSSYETLLGRFEESLMDVDRTGEGEIFFDPIVPCAIS